MHARCESIGKKTRHARRALGAEEEEGGGKSPHDGTRVHRRGRTCTHDVQTLRDGVWARTFHERTGRPHPYPHFALGDLPAAHLAGAGFLGCGVFDQTHPQLERLRLQRVVVGVGCCKLSFSLLSPAFHRRCLRSFPGRTRSIRPGGLDLLWVGVRVWMGCRAQALTCQRKTDTD